MGLFTQKPQFDDELPALPGEPLQPPSVAESLPDAAPVDAGTVGLLGGGVSVESIVIPVAPITEAAEDREPAAEG